MVVQQRLCRIFRCILELHVWFGVLRGSRRLTFGFPSIADNLNGQSSVHRDSNNHPILPSAVLQCLQVDSCGLRILQGLFLLMGCQVGQWSLRCRALPFSPDFDMQPFPGQVTG